MEHLKEAKLIVDKDFTIQPLLLKLKLQLKPKMLLKNKKHRRRNDQIKYISFYSIL